MVYHKITAARSLHGNVETTRLDGVQEFYDSIQPTGINGRLGSPNSPLFEMLPDPPKPRLSADEAKTWREKIKANIVRREEMIKGVPAMIKESVRARVYDYIFEWILEDKKPLTQTRLGRYPVSAKDDVGLHL